MRLSDDKIDHLADRILQRLLALEEEDDSVMPGGCLQTGASST